MTARLVTTCTGTVERTWLSIWPTMLNRSVGAVVCQHPSLVGRRTALERGCEGDAAMHEDVW